MKRLIVKNRVIRKAAKIAKRGRVAKPAAVPSFPLVRLWYPYHGSGLPTPRILKVVEMTNGRIHGFQIASVKDDGRGEYRTFDLKKVTDTIEFLGLKPAE